MGGMASPITDLVEPHSLIPRTKSPPPPKPPKPLHLTMSLRKSEKSKYPQMPRWSVAEDEDQVDLMKDFKIDNESCSNQLDDTPNYANSRRDIDRGLSDYLTETFRTAKQGSNLQIQTWKSGTSTIKKRGNRLSIFFDPLLPNPLIPPPATAGHHVGDASTQNEANEFVEEEVEEEKEIDLPTVALSAISVHDFVGESAFGELSFGRGDEVMIEVEDLGGNWSLGYLVETGEAGRGLIPLGFYKLVQVEPEEVLSDERDTPDIVTTKETIANETIEDTPPRQMTPPPVQVPAPSRPLPTPPIEIIHSPSPSTSPSTYASRSLERHTIVSGIEFEPLDFLSELPSVKELLELEEGQSKATEDAPNGDPKSENEKEVEVAEIANDAETMTDKSLVEEEPNSGLVPIKEALEEPQQSQQEISTVDERGASWDAMIEEAEKRYSSRNEASATEMIQLSPEPIWEDPVSRDIQSTEAETSHPESTGEEIVTPIPQAFTTRPLSKELIFPRPMEVAPPLQHQYKGIASPMLTHQATSLERAASMKIGKGKKKQVLWEWVENGSEEANVDDKRMSSYHIESPSIWKNDEPGWTVQIHSPEKRLSSSQSSYTIFWLSTTFQPSSSSNADPTSASEEPTIITVERRFNSFISIHQLLALKFPAICIPDLPPKTFTGRFSEEFVERRRNDLERWLSRISRHPVLRCCSQLRSFLTIESDKVSDMNTSNVVN